MDPVSIVLLLCYASLALELLVFAVPSEASSRRLLLAGGMDTSFDHALARAQSRPAVDKLLRYALPTALCVVLLLIPLVAVFWSELPDHLWPVTVARTAWLPWVGIGLAVAGRITTLFAALQLRRCGGEIEERGLFAVSRNPILVGTYAFYLGTCLVFPCVVLWLGFVPLAGYMHSRVLLEESHLVQKHGQRYEIYRNRVPRYLVVRSRN